MLLTFLQGFHEEIYKEDHTKPIRYAGNMLRMTIYFSILHQPLKMLVFHHSFTSELTYCQAQPKPKPNPQLGAEIALLSV